MFRAECILAAPAFAVFCLPAAPLTFHKDIEPILQNRCQSCHRPGEIAPMPLLTYQETRPWAKAIRSAVLTGKMPPWQADSRYGKFRNDLSLTPIEKGKLIAWIDSGAAEGNPSDAPKPKVFPEGWRIPKPDAVFEMPSEFEVPAKGAVDYQYIAVPTRFTQDKWVEMAEVQPSNASVVHHAIVVVEQNDGSFQEEYLAGYAPGITPQMWKPGEARLIKAGATLVFQMHYAANGKPSRDRTRIGLVFAKQPVTRQIVTMQAMGLDLKIPPGTAHYRVDARITMPRDMLLMGMRPHMHLRGKSFQFRAVYPNGESEILLDVPRYDFNWQPYYYLETPKSLPRGAVIECTAYFDNSPNNPFNPDPSATVTWGPQSWDEMMIGWLDLAAPAERGGSPELLRGALR
ncbi:MAG TPA: cytochrome c [Bryobacteraceae bacterium]|nr:cytochrome c [Bryobacteraceae bacterium]